MKLEPLQQRKHIFPTATSSSIPIQTLPSSLPITQNFCSSLSPPILPYPPLLHFHFHPFRVSHGAGSDHAREQQPRSHSPSAASSASPPAPAQGPRGQLPVHVPLRSAPPAAGARFPRRRELRNPVFNGMFCLSEKTTTFHEAFQREQQRTRTGSTAPFKILFWQNRQRQLHTLCF